MVEHMVDATVTAPAAPSSRVGCSAVAGGGRRLLSRDHGVPGGVSVEPSDSADAAVARRSMLRTDTFVSVSHRLLLLLLLPT